MLAIGAMYSYIVHFTHRTGVHPIQQRANQRDVVVLRRILLLVALLLILCLPAILLWLVFMITGYLHPLIYHFQWLTFAFSLAMLPSATVLMTPHLTQLVLRRWQRQGNAVSLIVLRADEHS